MVGTALLIVSGPGVVVAALTVRKSLDYAALSVVGLFFSLVVAIVIYAFGSTPGAHINPAVTVSLAGSCSAVSSGGVLMVGSMLGGVAAALSQDLIDRETSRRLTSRPMAPKVTWSDPASDRAQAARNRTGGTSRKR